MTLPIGRGVSDASGMKQGYVWPNCRTPRRKRRSEHPRAQRIEGCIGLRRDVEAGSGRRERRNAAELQRQRREVWTGLPQAVVQQACVRRLIVIDNGDVRRHALGHARVETAAQILQAGRKGEAQTGLDSQGYLTVSTTRVSTPTSRRIPRIIRNFPAHPATRHVPSISVPSPLTRPS